MHACVNVPPTCVTNPIDRCEWPLPESSKADCAAEIRIRKSNSHGIVTVVLEFWVAFPEKSPTEHWKSLPPNRSALHRKALPFRVFQFSVTLSVPQAEKLQSPSELVEPVW